MATATNLAENMSVNTSQAAFPDLHDLVHLFYDDVGELASFANQLGGTLPGPFDALLDHNHHMTVTLESHHDSPVNVHVLQVETKGGTYCRKILLRRQTDDAVVMFGIVRLHTQYLGPVVREEIESQQIPLGRVLINHNVLRRVELGKLWQVEPNNELQRHFQLDSPQVTFGRTAIIHCNEEPAIELVEIVAPE